MSESATEKHLIDPDTWHLRKRVLRKDLVYYQDKDKKDFIEKLNPKLFNEFLDNVYLCGGCMK